MELIIVSILVLVDVGLRLPSTLLVSTLFSVSILVLVDVGLRHCIINFKFVEWCVSILVLVDVGLRPYRRPSRSVQVDRVSILVLVDVGLRHMAHQALVNARLFQSLF